MRRYQKWLTVGLLALTTPGMVFAGTKAKPAPTSRAQSAAPARTAKQSANQEVANRVSQALGSSDLEIRGGEVEFQNGTAVLKGQVASAADKKFAETIVRKVKGVQNVQNKLEVPSQGGRVEQAAATQRRGAAKPVRQVAGYQENYEGVEPIQTPSVPPSPTGAPAAPGMYGGPAAMPAYGAPAYGPEMAGSNVIYNQPSLPNYAWPSYAQYPNYAQVAYPSQYSASAWPYIGPFYPYPQVPLGWRKAQLEWDDGYWHLNFSPRTERWWWFLDWRNW